MMNLANAVYRENQIWSQGSRGHSAMVWKFVGPLTRANLLNDEMFLIIEIAGPTNNKNLRTITDPDLIPFGCYTNPQVTYVQRLKILQAAKSLVGRNFGYPAFGSDVLLPRNWDGKLTTIEELRCDGLVEVCYEINGVEVWGMRRTVEANTVHYDITDQSDVWNYNPVFGTWTPETDSEPDNLEEHNDFDLVGWADVLMPATQCGYRTPEDAATRFQRQNLCVPVGSKGGNP
jgi:hypothetical protein